MDEHAVRELLDMVADDPLPPVRVSVRQAASRGRRKLRLRRVYLPGMAPVAAAAAVAIIASLASATEADQQQHHTAPAASARLPAVPGRFSALVPSVSFGWLPPGFSTAGLTNMMTLRTSELDLLASAADGRGLSLTVNPAGACKITGKWEMRVGPRKISIPYGITCAGQQGVSALSSRAPDLNGAPAYWSLVGPSLVFEYGRDAWADLTAGGRCIRGWCGSGGSDAKLLLGNKSALATGAPSAATVRLLYRVASQVRYGSHPAAHYAFKISGLPPSWRAGRPGSINNVATVNGHLVNLSWQAGPSIYPSALTISVAVAGTRPSICDQPSIARPIVIDGIHAKLWTQTMQGHTYTQNLCAPDVDGMQLNITLNLSTQGAKPRPFPGSSQVSDIRVVVSHLHLLGPDIATWTATPQD